MAVLRDSVAVFGVLFLTLDSAGAVDLAAHRAIYDMSLVKASRSSDVSAMEGEMYLEWADACDGWTVNQKVHMVSQLRDGPSVENHFNFSSWESYDGLRFRFAMRSLNMGDPVEQVAGSAYIRGAGKDGHVQFSVPEGSELELPAGTMFPSSHLIMLVEQAMAGAHHFERTVFSGSGTDSLNPVSVFIGNPIPGDERLPQQVHEGKRQPFAGLVGHKSWPVGLAYYPIDSHSAEPEFEVDYRLFDHGVASDLTLNYGDFVLSAVLEELELLPKPDC